MDEEAVKPNEEEQVVDETQEAVEPEAPEIDPVGNEGQPEGEEGEQPETDDQEFEIVRESSGSQPNTKKRSGLQKRFSKLTSKVADAEGRVTEASEELRIERERTKLLQLALDQKNAPPAPTLPNPEDFDDGVSDTKYVEAHQNYVDSVVKANVSAAMQTQTANVTAEQDKSVSDAALMRKKDAHYERAEELGAKDYGDREETTRGIFGDRIVDEIIKVDPESQNVLYYFGSKKNREVAEEIAELIKSDPVRGIWKLAELSKELVVPAKARTEPTPDPDEELEGGSPSASSSSERKYERDLDKMRTAVSDGKADMSKLIALKKKAREDGVIK